MVISKTTSWSTQEKSRLNAINATIQTPELLIWTNTSAALTLEWSPKNATSPIILALKLVLWMYTSANTLEKSPSSVVTVISLAKASAIVNDTNCLMMSQQLLKAVQRFLMLKKVVWGVRHSLQRLSNSRQLAKVPSESGGEHFYRTRVRSLVMLVTDSLTHWLTP